MKRVYIIYFILLAFVVSCTENFEEFNADEKNPSEVQGEFLFSHAQKELSDQISSTNVNLNIWKLIAQYWTETTYTDEENYDIVNRTIPDNIFDIYYTNVLKHLDEASTLIEEDELEPTETEAQRTNKLMIIELMEIYSYHRLVNMFGNIPYNNAMDIENISPVYDDAASIYDDLMSRVNNVINTLDPNAASFTGSDIIYEGNVSNWLKFANSLKLKMAINVADVDGQVSFSVQTMIEEAVTAGVLASAADNTLFPYRGSSPNTNTLYEDLVLSGRSDFVIANTLVDTMELLQDPRMDYYFRDPLSVTFPTDDQENKLDDTLTVSNDVLLFLSDGTQTLLTPDSIPTGDGNIYGVIIDVDTYGDLAPKYHLGGDYGFSASYQSHSHVGPWVIDPTFPGILMTYSEVQFYLAEAAARGYNVGVSAEDAYDEGVTASILYWGGTQAEAQQYLNNHPYTNYGTWQEAIGLQSWIASYTRGFLGYTTYRRLDQPDLMNTPDPDVYKTPNGVVPTRFTYPINEQTLNAANYNDAASAIGGDDLTTTLFWDISTPFK